MGGKGGSRPPLPPSLLTGGSRAAGARRAVGASPERGRDQAGQPWGRSGRRRGTLRQAPRDAPWEPRAEATLSGEPREELAALAPSRLPLSALPGPGGRPGEAGRGAGRPCCVPTPRLGPGVCRGASSL